MELVTIICISVVAYPIGRAIGKFTADVISSIGAKKSNEAERTNTKDAVFALTGTYPEVAVDMEKTTGEKKFRYIYNGTSKEVSKTK